MRRDRSSRVGAGNAWATSRRLPSPGACRRNRSSAKASVSDLKVRASWGITGNQQFGSYAQYAAYALGDARSQVQFGNGSCPPSAPPRSTRISSGNRPSPTTSASIGASMISESAAPSTGTTRARAIYFTVPVAAGSNFSNFLTTNIGSMKNSGIEVALDARVIDGGRRGFSWNTNFNASHNTNELTSINPIGRRRTEESDRRDRRRRRHHNRGVAAGQAYQLVLRLRADIRRERKTAARQILRLHPQAYHDPAPKWKLGHTSACHMPSRTGLHASDVARELCSTMWLLISGITRRSRAARRTTCTRRC